MNGKGWIFRTVFVPLAVAVNMALATLSMSLLTGIVAV